jgi:hypothetical protein
MNTSHQDQALEARIDAVLERQAVWTPPHDFAKRIAAAAARQAQQPRAQAIHAVTVGEMLRHLEQWILVSLACGAVAGLIGWVIPWSSMVHNTQLLSWTSLWVCLPVGLWLTIRTLRHDH